MSNTCYDQTVIDCGLPMYVLFMVSIIISLNCDCKLRQDQKYESSTAAVDSTAVQPVSDWSQPYRSHVVEKARWPHKTKGTIDSLY